MSEILKFAGEHWFLAWSALWLAWIPYFALAITAKLVNRVFRMVMVSARGWPPAHLDADGDWKPEPDQST